MHQTNVNYHNQIHTLEDKVQDLTKQNKILADQVWENKERTKTIEQALIFFANYMKSNSTGEEFSRHFPALDNMLSITDIPNDSGYKRQKIEENEHFPQSPLNFSGFEDDFLMSPKAKCEASPYDAEQNSFDIGFSDQISDTSVDIDKIDFLLDQ